MRRNISFRSLCVVDLIYVLAVTGCNKSRSDLVPVSGLVTIDGKPLTVGQITVMPEGHRMSYGKLDKDGHFQLTCYEPGDGVPVGQHIATVTALESVSEHSNRWHAPKKYANKATGVWVTIDGPTDNLKVELTWGNSNQKGPFVDKF